MPAHIVQADDARQVEALAQQLERLAGPVALGWEEPPLGGPPGAAASVSSMQLLSGTWRLLYSSGFNGGSLGGRRPGPPAAVVPAALGSVYQVIDPQTVSFSVGSSDATGLLSMQKMQDSN